MKGLFVSKPRNTLDQHLGPPWAGAPRLGHDPNRPCIWSCLRKHWWQKIWSQHTIQSKTVLKF